MLTATALMFAALLPRLCYSIELEVTKALDRDRYLDVSSAYFEIHKSSRLSLAPSTMNVTTMEDCPMECGFLCIRLPWCLSYNFKRYRGSAAKHLCEVLSIDKYKEPRGFRPSADFDHYSVKVNSS